MDDQITPALAQSSAVRAFEELRGEVSLLRRGIQALTAEREDTPDYTPTLAAIDQRLQAVSEWARKVSDRPGIKLTPDELATQIERAGVRARTADAEALRQAGIALKQATCSLDAMLARARSAADQRRWLLATAITCLVAGVLLGALLK
jgi:hypothetical protein